MCFSFVEFVEPSVVRAILKAIFSRGVLGGLLRVFAELSA